MSERNTDPSLKGSNKGQSKDTDIDHLLRQTLKDDIPPDVRISMKAHLDKFRHKMEKGKIEKVRAGQKGFRGKVPFKDARWAHVLFKKEALVVVSLLMIVLGGFIQSSGSSNELTENLSAIGTSVVVLSEMSRSQSMECSIQMAGEDQEPLHYLIQWLPPNLLKIAVKGSENTLLKTLWFSADEITIADHVNDRVQKKRHLAQFDDPMIRPIVGFLTPAELLEQMYGEWKLLKTEQKGECNQGIYKVLLPNEMALLEVTVDQCTFVPVSIKKMLPAEEQGEMELILNVQYAWNIPLSMEDFLPRPINES